MAFVPSGIGIDEYIVLVGGAHIAVCAVPRDAGECIGFTIDQHGELNGFTTVRGSARPLTVRGIHIVLILDRGAKWICRSDCRVK
jgi:hypothetical protein